MADIHERIKQDRDQHTEFTEIPKYRSYAVGNHSVTLTDKQKEVLRNLLANKFCDNICHQIIFEAANRITFERWESKNEAVDAKLRVIYATSKIEALQGKLNYRALRDGNSAIILGWSKARKSPVMHLENWWNGTSGVYVHYGDDGEVEYAVKEWKTQADETGSIRRIRRTVYQPGIINRYISDNGSTWDTFKLPSDGDEEDIRWVNPKTQKPMAIPVIHFSNAGKEPDDNEGGVEFFGFSELAGGVLGFQDQLNDTQYSLSSCIRHTGYQMYWVSGIKLPKVDGVEVEPEVKPGNFFTSTDPTTKWGVFPAGSVEQIITAYNKKLSRVAQMTHTPIHVITGGDWPSGDALLRAELPAVGKAHRQISQFRASWIEVGHRVIEMINAFGEGSAKLDESPETALITGVFGDPEKRDIVSRSNVVHNMAGKISRAEGLRILGYPEDKVQTIVQEMLDEEATILAQTIALTPAPDPEKGAMGGKTPKKSETE